jgi:hypothetical protein
MKDLQQANIEILPVMRLVLFQTVPTIRCRRHATGPPRVMLMSSRVRGNTVPGGAQGELGVVDS